MAADDMQPLAIIAGALANKPGNGGAAWTRLSWALGLARIGFRILFVERIAKGNCRDSQGERTKFDRSFNLEHFRRTVRRFGLEEDCALVCGDGEQFFGSSRGRILESASEAELLLNISGHLDDPEVLEKVPRRIYLDLDPGFTQFWHDQGHDLGLREHDFHFTVGENIGRPNCSIPTGGFDWRPIRQPVLLDHWPACFQDRLERFTTVASWRAPYGAVNAQGRHFGLKHHEFRRFLELPLRSGLNFEMALEIHPDEIPDLDKLKRCNWRIVDPRREAGGVEEFRSYIQRSGGEFSAAQGMYVDTVSGWFSDRSVRYLCSGKPVLVQDTGFSQNYPTGQGLLSFSSLEEAVEGACAIASDYPAHAQAARGLALEHFAAEKVLSDLLDQIGLVAKGAAS